MKLIYTVNTVSATVIALRDSLLLKLGDANCKLIWNNYPGVLLEVTKMIARRLRHSMTPLLNDRHRALNLIIFPGHRDVNIDLFIEQLTASFDSHYKYN